VVPGATVVGASVPPAAVVDESVSSPPHAATMSANTARMAPKRHRNLFLLKMNTPPLGKSWGTPGTIPGWF
jgi:hypothetical protein